MDVPTTHNLSEVYPDDALASQTKRWNDLISQFKENYGKLPDYISRSPGRVNLIGEHIDYSLYSVIPMAVTADVLLAVSITPSDASSQPTIHISNTNPTKFPSATIPLTTHPIPIDASTHSWTNYFLAGLRAATTHLTTLHPNQTITHPTLQILVSGTVPSGGGLSSSAAFVCASALAVLRAHNVTSIPKTALVELAVVAERAVGVNSGGMDQAASVCAERGAALYVSFVPELAAEKVVLPGEGKARWVVAQSFVAADKHVTAPECYNLRVVEVTLAALVLGRVFGLEGGLEGDAGPLGVSLRGFHEGFVRKVGSEGGERSLEEELKELVAKVDEYLPQEEGYTKEQIAEILGLKVEELEERYMKKFPIRADKFKLRQRATHVFTEAIRVLKFKGLLATSPTENEQENVDLLKAMGELLNDTQESCRDVYENSCPELDELCELARSAGAYGSRLTGAGWGGCSVHLVPEEKVEKVKSKWINDYYKKKFPDITAEKLEEAIVVSKPGSGSCVFDVNGRDALVA